MITYVFEPHRLILTWKPHTTSSGVKLAVAELVHVHGNVIFRYMRECDDYKQALAAGFIGYPAFNIDVEIHNFGVMDAFVRRLPPRRRADFNTYLEQFGLKPDMPASDFSLLGYTGAKLPSDPFELFMDLSLATAPLDLLLEIAGFRHTQPDVDSQNIIGLPLTFWTEPENEYDKNAIAVYQGDFKIGFVSRVMCASFLEFMKRGRVTAKICKLNGHKGFTTAYMLVSFR